MSIKNRLKKIECCRETKSHQKTHLKGKGETGLVPCNEEIKTEAGLSKAEFDFLVIVRCQKLMDNGRILTKLQS